MSGARSIARKQAPKAVRHQLPKAKPVVPPTREQLEELAVLVVRVDRALDAYLADPDDTHIVQLFTMAREELSTELSSIGYCKGGSNEEYLKRRGIY